MYSSSLVNKGQTISMLHDISMFYVSNIYTCALKGSYNSIRQSICSNWQARQPVRIGLEEISIILAL